MLGLKIARLLDSTWTFVVLFFGALVSIVFASGYAAGTVYPSESWMNYGWPVGFGLMAGAAFVAAFTWNWVRLLEVALMSLAFAGAYREAGVWPDMRSSLLWLTLAVTAAVFMIGSVRDEQQKKLGPNDRIIWPALIAIVLGLAACVTYGGWTVIVSFAVSALLLLAVTGSLPDKRAYRLATR